jgi:hypothetical protein
LTKKLRANVPRDVATEVLFLSDRTCCVCRERKPVQIHHIDENPSNCDPDNLAVLCLDCHHQTQSKGGFDRKLDAHLVRRYREDWISSVAAKRAAALSPSRVRKTTDPRGIRYTTLQESSEEDRYWFSASFIEVETADPQSDAETNLLINAAVLDRLQRFRAGARDRIKWKQDCDRFGDGPEPRSDQMQIDHEVVMFTEDMLSLRLETYQYNVGAAHGNDWTVALNFRLRPSLRLEPAFLFRPHQNYAERLSEICVPRLKKQQREKWAGWGGAHPGTEQDDWIGRGASPDAANFKTLLLQRGAVRVVFDNYQVASFSEGRYEIVIERGVLADQLDPDIYALLG